MDFTAKYTTNELILIDLKEKDKIVVSNDAYAIGEMLKELTDEISRARLQK